MTIAQLTSRIEKVKVYSTGATVTRIAELPLTSGELPEQIEVAGIPLVVDDSSVRVRVEVERGTAPLASDVRIGLAVPPPQETPNPPPDEEIRAAAAVVQQLQELQTLIDNEIDVLNHLHVPNRPKEEPGKAPPPSPTSARLALANFSDEQIRLRIQEKRENKEKLGLALEHLADLQQKQRHATSARDARPNELRKTVIVSLSYEGEPPTTEVGRLVVEYFVPGARWTPTYVCRLNSAESSASIAVRALICQRTGEDWSGVRLELSTAEPMAWCTLPELPSLRLGRSQSLTRKSGWRQPPFGTEILFEDFDRQKEAALAAVPRPIIPNFSSVSVSSLPHLFARSPERELLSIKEEIEREMSASEAVDVFTPLQNISLEPYSEIPDEPTAQIPIEDLQISVLTYNCLKRAQINSVADLLDYTQEDLLHIENFKQQSAEEVVEALQRRWGITLPLERSDRNVSRAYEYRSIGAGMAMPVSREKPILQKKRLRRSSSAEKNLINDLLTYGIMRMGAADDPAKRGKLSIEQRHEVYLESLKRQEVVVHFNVIEVIQNAIANAQHCLTVPLPDGGIHVRNVAGSFDYAYSADGRVDVPSDGQFHSVALTSKTTDVDLRYIVVPRKDTNVFRIAQLRNPLQAPLLAGSTDVYVDGEYILSTNIATVPPQGQMELGLGVEQAIKVARNVSYHEVRSGETIVAFNELRHKIKIDITNLLPRTAKIEVRERLPIPAEGAKVDVQIKQVTPMWEKYEQEERSTPIRGGYRWQIEVPAKDQTILSVDFIIKTFVDSELIGGNRRER